MAKKESPVLQLLEIVWANSGNSGWRLLNHAMHSTLRTAIGTGFQFDPETIRSRRQALRR